MVVGGRPFAHATNATEKIDGTTLHVLRRPMLIVNVYMLRTASVPTTAA
jgi:hypothetical protein